MDADRPTIFARHRKKTLATVLLLLVLAAIAAAELLLRTALGLGHPVIYDTSALYGYRPLPSRQYTRFHGAQIRFNNLGLRAEVDFDPDPNDKILFLGDSVTYGGSRIDNKDLFSYLATANLEGFKGGNAGVNAWGVENIYGLVVESGFRPARVYVTLLPERAFYRGLAHCRGMPFFNVPPRFALTELWYFFCTKQAHRKHRDWRQYADQAETRRVVEKAVVKLEEMDALLRRDGCQHLLFITPTQNQVVGDQGKDPLVLELLEEHNLPAMYISDMLASYGLSEQEAADLFYDSVHLQLAGHQIWAQVIRDELRKCIKP